MPITKKLRSNSKKYSNKQTRYKHSQSRRTRKILVGGFRTGFFRNPFKKPNNLIISLLLNQDHMKKLVQ